MVRIAAASLLLFELLSQSTTAAHPADDRKNHYEQDHQAAGVGIERKLRHTNKSSESREIGNHCNSWSSPCDLRNNYCFIEEGKCMEEVDGTCQAKPEICTREEDPVCGCGGVTFSNACDASANGVNVWHKGHYQEGNSCSPTNPCKNTENYFCKISEVSCGKPLAAQHGICTYYNEFGITSCIGSWEPVCGCDGIIYSNSCAANDQEGVNVSYRLDSSDDDIRPGGNCEIQEQTTDDRRAKRKAAKEKKKRATSSTSSSSSSSSSKSEKTTPLLVRWRLSSKFKDHNGLMLQSGAYM